MKGLIIIFLLIPCFLKATTYYIDPGGSNANNGTSSGTAWLTLTYACAHATTPGDIIHVNAGSYTETVQSVLSVGVSIEGAGVTSIIHSRISDSSTYTILLSSVTQNTNGNQHITNIKMIGDTLLAYAAIRVYQRGNVAISGCTFQDFHWRGVTFEGYANSSGADSISVFTKSNSFHDNIITNCSGFSGVKVSGTGMGCLNIDGQDSMNVYNNTITQTARALGSNGYPIKCAYGHNRAVKIYNNTIAVPPADALSWGIAIELWDCRGGMEVYNNVLKGNVDVAGYHTRADSAVYSVYIHDNTIGQDTLGLYSATYGIVLEGDVSDVIIASNTIYNVANGILFSQQGSARTVYRVSIYTNILDNIGITSTNGNGRGITWSSDQSNNIVNTVSIWNNTLSAHVGANTTVWGIMLPNIGSNQKNISVRNNIVKSFSYCPIFMDAGTIDILSIENNDFYLTGNSNAPLYTGGTRTNNTTQNNLTSNPLFVSSSDYHLQFTSPCIDAGISVGMSFTGSLPDIGAYEYSSLDHIIRKQKIITY